MVSEWISVKFGNHTFKLRNSANKLEVQGYDLEATLIAYAISNLPPQREDMFLLICQDLYESSNKSLSALKVILNEYQEQKSWISALKIKEMTSPLALIAPSYSNQTEPYLESLRNPYQASRVIDFIIDTASEVVSVELINNPNLNTFQISRLEKKIIRLNSEATLVRLLKLPNTASDLLKKYSNSDSRDIRLAIASHHNTFPQVISELAEVANNHYEVAMRAISNPHLPPPFDKYVYSSDTNFKHAIACNTSLSEVQLDHLSQDESVFVRMSVAKNPSTDQATLKNLVFDSQVMVRRILVENPNLSISDLGLLTQDPAMNVAHLARSTLARREFSLGVGVEF